MSLYMGQTKIPDVRIGGGGPQTAVLYTPMEPKLTVEQQLQAKANIGAGDFVTPQMFYNEEQDKGDWSRAIQYCLDNYTDIFIPEGKYQLVNGLTISKGNIHISGAGKLNTELFFKNPGVAINLMPNSGRTLEFISIRDIGITGNFIKGDPKDTDTLYGIYFSTYVAIFEISHCFISRFRKSCICGGHDFNANNININNCNLRICGEKIIDFNQFEGKQVNAVYIEQNEISTSDEDGIDVWGQNIVIRDNSIQGTTKHGVSVNGSVQGIKSGCLGITISGNYFEQNLEGAIYLGWNENYEVPIYNRLNEVIITENYIAIAGPENFGAIDINNTTDTKLVGSFYISNNYFSNPIGNKKFVNTHGSIGDRVFGAIKFKEYTPNNYDENSYAGSQTPSNFELPCVIRKTVPIFGRNFSFREVQLVPSFAAKSIDAATTYAYIPFEEGFDSLELKAWVKTKSRVRILVELERYNPRTGDHKFNSLNQMILPAQDEAIERVIFFKNTEKSRIRLPADFSFDPNCYYNIRLQANFYDFQPSDQLRYGFPVFIKRK